ncbi:uncharacterized protein LOC123518674 [Portunus trituberculatus]|uniref:uncharacterized protein LOC123518674 n=1 Tax=Portunus trituberculatus TaxID=210409 RepID=UPI001E1CD173|nr:uncharacterized protein LOC123518674 [Portunus trituberculatus]
MPTMAGVSCKLPQRRLKCVLLILLLVCFNSLVSSALLLHNMFYHHVDLNNSDTLLVPYCMIGLHENGSAFLKQPPPTGVSCIPMYGISKHKEFIIAFIPTAL